MLVKLAMRCGFLFAGMLLGLACFAASAARAQQIIVIVNGEPITALDVEQRSKLNQLSHKVAPRQEVIEELINDVLKIKEAKKFNFEISESEVNSAFATMASRMRLTPDQLTQMLAKQGIAPTTLKQRIKADLTWPQLVRGRYSASLQIGEKDILPAAADPKPEDSVGYDYTLRPILLIFAPGSGEGVIEARRRDAEALRGRFQGCDAGIAFARALKDVAVRDQVLRSSADLPLELRKLLDSTEVGKLTPPETTKLGVETFAVCAKKESAADNTPGKRRAREALMQERYERLSKQYLNEVRRGAMLEYK